MTKADLPTAIASQVSIVADKAYPGQLTLYSDIDG
jgi:hypothetical protein